MCDVTASMLIHLSAYFDLHNNQMASKSGGGALALLPHSFAYTLGERTQLKHL